MKNRILSFVILPAVVLYAPLVISAEYLIDADISPTLRYDDNVELRRNKEGSFSTEITPTLMLSRTTSQSTLGLDLGYRIEKFASLSDLDREDPFARFSSSLIRERSVFGLDAEYSENAQRSIAEEDTGDFASDATVTTRALSPSFQYQLTERDFVYTNLSYLKRTYSGTDVNDGFLDNETYSYTGGWFRNLSERLSAGLALTYATYEAKSALRESEYDTYNLAVTSEYRLNEQWSFSGQVGYRTVQSKNSFENGETLRDRSSGSLFSLTTKYEGLNNNFSVALARELNPSGEGAVNEMDSIRFDWLRMLTERVDFTLSGLYQQTQDIDSFNNTKRDFMFISPGLRWALQENIALNFGYQFRKQKGDNVETADSNMVFVTLNYDWGGKRFSR